MARLATSSSSVDPALVAADDARFEACLAQVRALAPGDAEGVFGPGSLHWMIFREPLVVLGGIRAIALQVAHPRIATGVSENSNFRNDVLGRARRTFAAMYEMVFGDVDEAVHAARRVYRLHQRIHGVVGPAAGAADGQPYRAMDPELLHWVLATCVDTVSTVFDLFVRPLTLGERETFYQESMRFGLLFGLPVEARPQTWLEFRGWMDSMVDGGPLHVGPLARELAGDLFNSPYTRGPLDELLTAGLLAPHYREAFGLRWGPREERLFRGLVTGLRATHRVVPENARFVVAWHQAVHRVNAAQGRPSSLYARLINRVDTAVSLPFSIRPVAINAVGDDLPRTPRAADGRRLGPAARRDT